MDREALVLRNRAMAEAFHTVPLKHQIRRMLLRAVAAVPVLPQRRRGRAERILLIRPDHLGDVLLTTPAIRALRRALPTVELHALVGGWSAGVLAHFPEIDTVLTLPFPGFTRMPNDALTSAYKLAFDTARMLRRIGYSRAVILRPDHWWGALVAFLAGIPQRIGSTHPDVAPFLTDALPLSREHVVLQNAHLLTPIHAIPTDDLDLTFPVTDEDTAWARGFLSDQDKPPIAVHVGAGTAVKHWLPEKWAKVADVLADQLETRVLLTGGEHEAPIAYQIAAHMQHTPLFAVGETTIGTLAALFARCALVLGADSGPMHLAAAVGTRTVTLYGPADPAEFGIWGSPDRQRMLYTDIGCRPCRVLDWSGDDLALHPCVREITVARVLEAARSTLYAP